MRRVNDPPRIPRLRRDAHKGDRGRVLLVAGSRTMSGAARLCGWGALRGGAGLVTIATPAEVQAIVAAALAPATTLPLPSGKGCFTAAGAETVRAFLQDVDAVAIGPGITTGVAPFLRGVLKGLDKPLVLDADALNLLAKEPGMLAAASGPRVMTPHPGEASRLLARDVPSDQEGRLAAAREIAERFDAVCVLKGAGTVVCDGDRYYVCRHGNPGMATGGTGDVLTGLVAARLGAGAEAFAAAVQSVYIHERAGDLAAAVVGEHAMIATDLIAHLPGAMAELAETKAKPRPRSGSRRRSR